MLEGIGALSPRAIIIGPSNPVISIGPILALDGVKPDAIPVMPQHRSFAVSPLVEGNVVKGPTAASHALDRAGLLSRRRNRSPATAVLLDGLVADQPAGGLPVLRNPDVLMAGAEGRGGRSPRGRSNSRSD